MKVEKLMSSGPAFCQAGSTLAVVVTTMRDRNCGFVPIVDAARHVVGVVTDRDAAIALAEVDRRPSEVSAAEVMTAPALTCQPTDTAQSALQRMQQARVRRLAVVDGEGVLVGVLSIGDIVPSAQNIRAGVDRLSYEQVMDALKAICTR
jgi:CBS domain-containing protein